MPHHKAPSKNITSHTQKRRTTRKKGGVLAILTTRNPTNTKYEPGLVHTLYLLAIPGAPAKRTPPSKAASSAGAKHWHQTHFFATETLVKTLVSSDLHGALAVVISEATGTHGMRYGLISVHFRRG